MPRNQQRRRGGDGRHAGVSMPGPTIPAIRGSTNCGNIRSHAAGTRRPAGNRRASSPQNGWRA